jgi:molybdate transport system substrate-binding protein
VNRPSLLRAAGAFATACVVAAAAATPAGAATTISAEVASSVGAAFAKLADLYDRKHPGTTIAATYLGGQVIQADVEADNPIDVVIVGKSQTDKLAAHIGTPVAILTNREVVLVPRGSTKIRSLKDLGNPGVKVALGIADSAVGKLARDVLKKAVLDPAYGADFAAKVRGNTVFEGKSGVEVVNAVANGTADAAIAFVSDVDPSKFGGVAIPPSVNVDSVYYAFVPKAAKNAAAGADVVRFVSSPQGLVMLRSYRFLPPPKP